MTAPEERETANSAPEGRRGRIPADTFANRLLLARAMAGHVSIREAALMTGLNRGSWEGWERGRRPRDILDAAQRIAEALDVDEQWLLFGGPLAGPRGMPVNPSRRSTDGPGPLPRAYREPTTRPRGSRPNTRPVSVQRPGIPPSTEQRRPVRMSRPHAA
jgi:hypothetical protein